MRSSRRERIILTVTLILVGLYALDSWVLTPLMARNAELGRQLERLEADLLANQNKIRKRRALARKWSDWVKSSLKQEASETESQILNAVRSWAHDAGIKLVSIQPERPSQKGELREIRFQASANGSYASLVRFLYLLESTDVPVRTQNVELRPVRGADSDSDRLVLSLRFSTLYRVPERREAQPRSARRSAARRSPDRKLAYSATGPESSGKSGPSGEERRAR